jgi:hypothetical protein
VGIKSKVSSGNKPDKKLYKLAGILKESANICLIITCADMNFNTAVRAPPIKICTINVVHKKELLIIFIDLESIY